MWFLHLVIISFVTSEIDCSLDNEPSQGYEYWKTIEQYPRDQQKSFSNERGNQNLDAEADNPYHYQYSQYNLGDRYVPYEDYHQEIERPTKVSKALAKGLKKISDRTFTLLDQNGRLLGLSSQSVVGLVLTTIAFGGLAVLLSNDLVFPTNKVANNVDSVIAPAIASTLGPAIVTPRDPCAGIACGPLGDICVRGVCMCGSNPICGGNANSCVGGVCRCGALAACSLPASNICSGLPGTCMCGLVAACVPTSLTPSCLEIDGITVPSFTSITVTTTCKCTVNSCVSGTGAAGVAPFCGTSSSAVVTVGNAVAVGMCGKCQITPKGGNNGVANACTSGVASNAAQCNIMQATSCGPATMIGPPLIGLVCCNSGECASVGALAARGSGCSA